MIALLLVLYAMRLVSVPLQMVSAPVMDTAGFGLATIVFSAEETHVNFELLSNT